MTYLHTIILGIIEGITEFLPISSTAHLSLASDILQIPTTEFLKSFEIIIQLGAILAVVLLFFKNVIKNKKLLLTIIIAFIPTGIVGFLLYSLIKGFLLGNTFIIAIALIVGGVVMIYVERKVITGKLYNTIAEKNSLTYKDAFIVGLAQSLAVIPGVSRSAATIIGGRLLHISRKTIVEFSFLLAIPTMLTASIYDIYKNIGEFSLSNIGLLVVGFITAFIFALIAIKWLIHYVENHSFVTFGWYRIILGVLILVILYL